MFHHLLLIAAAILYVIVGAILNDVVYDRTEGPHPPYAWFFLASIVIPFWPLVLLARGLYSIFSHI